MNPVRFDAIRNLVHNPSGHGKGKWQTRRGIKRYKMQRRKLNNIAENSRRNNWN